MSARFEPVGWNRAKLAYDAVLVSAVLLYLLLYLWAGPLVVADRHAPDDQTLAMRAWGSLAFLLLTSALAIGPLCRLDRRFLPLLYNRRHLGVVTCAVAAGHANAVLGWYYAYAATPAWQNLLAVNTASGQVAGFPFVPFGLAAFVILCALAFTSHDFWLVFLTPPLWKALHMLIYAAYACAVVHVSLGALQDGRAPLLAGTVLCSAVLLGALHVAAARRDRCRAARVQEGWIVVGPPDHIPDQGGRVVPLPGAEPAAVFRDGDRLSAVTNLCAHQNGPLGEGRVIDGCITCPWHGFQYRLADGCAPPPFTEKLATYRLLLRNGTVLLDPRPNPAGTYVEPLLAPLRAGEAA